MQNLENEFASFLGPKAENGELLKKLILKVLDTQYDWRRSAYPEDPALFMGDDFPHAKLEAELDKFLDFFGAR